MKIEKLPSGSYRIRKMYKGKNYTVVFDYKPTQKEAMLAMAKELEKVQEKNRSMKFQDAAEQYIESKRNVLSPSTVGGYRNILNLSCKKIYTILSRLMCRKKLTGWQGNASQKLYVTTMASYLPF